MEYRSIFTGSSDRSLVQQSDLNDCRVVKQAEERFTKEPNVDNEKVSYILAYDVARSQNEQSAQSSLAVIKCIEKGDGTYTKKLVNIYGFKGSHFKDQAIFIKKKFFDFKASMIVVDANGVGRGLVDFLVVDIDEKPTFSVVNDKDFDKFKQADSIPCIFSLISSKKETKASAIHDVFINTIFNHQLKILVSEVSARGMLDGKYEGEELAEKLLPFISTDRFFDEVMNLEYVHGANGTQVKQISSGMNKDRFSAVEYGLFYIYLEERRNQQRKRECETDINVLAKMYKKPKYKRFRR